MSTRIEKTNTPAPASMGPGRAGALEYIAAELEGGKVIPQATLEWMARGAILSQQIDQDLEFMVEGEIIPGRENTFILRNKVTGNGDFEIPDDPTGIVTDNKTGKPMGTLRTIMDFGRWIVGAAHYSHRQNGLG